jgi:hypothetical protein
MPIQPFLKQVEFFVGSGAGKQTRPSLARSARICLSLPRAANAALKTELAAASAGVKIL